MIEAVAHRDGPRAAALRPGESHYVEIRGLRYHFRHWRGDPGRRVVLLHGWMDV